MVNAIKKGFATRIIDDEDGILSCITFVRYSFTTEEISIHNRFEYSGMTVRLSYLRYGLHAAPTCRICGKEIKKISCKYRYCSLHSGMVHECRQSDKFKNRSIKEIEKFIKDKERTEGKHGRY